MGLSYRESTSHWTLGCFLIQFGLGPLASRLAPHSSALWPSSLIVFKCVPFSIDAPVLSSFSRRGLPYFWRVAPSLAYFAFFFDCIIRERWKSSSYWFAERSWYLAEALISYSRSILRMSSSSRGSLSYIGRPAIDVFNCTLSVLSSRFGDFSLWIVGDCCSWVGAWLL